MRDRFALGVVALFAVMAGGGWRGHLPSQQYVDSALGATAEAVQTLHPTKPVVVVERAPTPRASRHAGYRVDYRVMAYHAARAAGIREPRLFVRQMAAESGFNPCVGSPAGAVGIAQIMPSTAASWHVDPFMPQQALLVSARRMATYERQLGSYSLALAAYNAGPGAVQRYHGVPPFHETQTYVARITGTGPIWGMEHSVFTLPPHFTGTFQSRLRALRMDVIKRGGHLTVVSGQRGYAEQVQLWQAAKRKYGSWQAARKWVAPPGCSNHNRGIAADLRGNLSLAHRLAARHGLRFPMSYEPWHVETA